MVEDNLSITGGAGWIMVRVRWKSQEAGKVGVRFILGRAGTGKTSLCLRELREALGQGEEGPSLILLVPEQATLQMERELVCSTGSHATARAQVLSFRRLAWRVFQEVGGAARPHLGELGKRMALRALLERHRGELTLFAPLADRPGFSKQLAQAVAELRTYRVAPEDLRRQAKLLAEGGLGETPLALKLHDLVILYAGLEEYLAGRYLDPDDYLNLLAQQLPASSLARGALVWVDGFTGFTPQEEEVLKAVFAHAGGITLTLCLDPGELKRPGGEADLFQPTRETLERLTGLARECGVPTQSEALGESHRFLVPALAHLERCWTERPPVAFAGRPEGVRLVAAPNPRAEVEAAARELVRLARERGYRWREMAVLARDLESYHDLILNVFKDHGIPCFPDRRRPVSHHPLLELIRSALEVVLENWAYDPVFRYLKCDLVPVARESVDRLENYVLAHGIRGKAWTDEQPWGFRLRLSLGEKESPPAEEAFLARLHAWRERATRSLRGFEARVGGTGGPGTVHQVTEALLELLLELKVPRRLELWHRQALEAGDPDAAQEHLQVWNGVLDTLEQVVEALGEERLPLAEYARVLEAGLEGLSLGLIPPSLDQVLVGSLERSRQPKLQAVLVLGAHEGAWPARQAEDPILGDSEREELRSSGLELAPAAWRRLLREQYLTYLALTRSCSFLWLSYPLADREGRTLAPAPVVRQLRQIFPGLELAMEDGEPTGLAGDLDLVIDVRHTAALLLRRLEACRDPGVGLEPLWREAYRWLVADASGRAALRAVTGGLFQSNLSSPLPAKEAGALFPEPYTTSVSRLETFAACPFAHFAAYGLRLKERLVYRMEAPERGEFYHEALRRAVEELQRSGRDWGDLSSEEAARLAGKVAMELARELQGEILLSTARYRYLLRRLTRTLGRAVEALSEHARWGSFRPAAVELSFGEEGGLPPLSLDLGEGRTLRLRGRLDRVDLAREGDTLYLRVVDYKSRTTNLDLDRIFYGLSLQLPLYLRVALDWAQEERGEKARPAGLLYFAVFDPLLKVKAPPGPGEVPLARLKKLKMRGLLLGEAPAIKLMDSRGGNSPLVPAQVNRDGSLGRLTRAAGAREMESLLQLAARRAASAGRSVRQGETAINPYRLGQETPCGFCDFRPVCAFDPALPGNRYRVLKRLEGQDFWAKVATEQRGGSGDD